jgi:hypothetical protein
MTNDKRPGSCESGLLRAQNSGANIRAELVAAVVFAG